jgi:hypothetical protein
MRWYDKAGTSLNALSPSHPLLWLVVRPVMPLPSRPALPRPLDGPRPWKVTARDVRPVRYGPWCTAREVRPVMYGPWGTARDVRPVRYGPWGTARDVRPVMYDPWCTAREVRPVQYGPWSVKFAWFSYKASIADTTNERFSVGKSLRYIL